MKLYSKLCFNFPQSKVSQDTVTLITLLNSAA